MISVGPRCIRSSPALMTIPEDGCCKHLSMSTDDPVQFINMERRRHHLPALERSAELDWSAQLHAFHMASSSKVFNSVETIEDLRKCLGSPVVGEIVLRDESLFLILCKMMASESSIHRASILSKQFSQFGSATLTGSDGKIYFCQVFRGTP